MEELSCFNKQGYGKNLTNCITLLIIGSDRV